MNRFCNKSIVYRHGSPLEFVIGTKLEGEKNKTGLKHVVMDVRCVVNPLTEVRCRL